MKKKLLLVLMSALLAFSMVACSGASDLIERSSLYSEDDEDEDDADDEDDEDDDDDKDDKKSKSRNIEDCLDIDELEDWTELEAGQEVHMTIDMVWDYFYAETEGEGDDEYETAVGYLLPYMVYYEEYEDVEPYYFIGTYIDIDDCDIFDKMCDETGEWYDVWQNESAMPEDYLKTSVEITGVLREMTDEEVDLAYDYFIQTGMTEEEIDDYMITLMIDDVEYVK